MLITLILLVHNKEYRLHSPIQRSSSRALKMDEEKTGIKSGPKLGKWDESN